MEISSIPISLYIHMPWCVQKCPYCDFNSHAVRGKIPEERYIDQLCAEWDLRKTDLQGRKIHSVFIGGGTPSLIQPVLIEKLLNHIAKDSPLAENIEITMEANPGTIDSKHFINLPKTGINRISLGIQSFNESHLKMLGRIHDSKQAKQAFIFARDAGFDNINIDLMHGLPGQNISQAKDDLIKAIELQPEHLSWYQLTIEPNTHFAKFPPTLPQDDDLAEIQNCGEKYLSEYNYQQYEVSAFCLEEKSCVHNNNYWHFGDYIGIGAGAHSKVSYKSGSIYRYYNTKHPKRYLALNLSANQSEVSFAVEKKILQQNDLIIEFMLCALRLRKSIDHNLFTRHTGLNWNLPTMQKKLKEAETKGLINIYDRQISTTKKGNIFLNELLELFV